MIEFIKKVLSDENGIPSSKRLIGLMGGISLIAIMFIYHNDTSIDAVLVMTLGALGISGAVSIFKK
jgi:hypothetical protein